MAGGGIIITKKRCAKDLGVASTAGRGRRMTYMRQRFNAQRTRNSKIRIAMVFDKRAKRLHTTGQQSLFKLGVTVSKTLADGP